MQAEEVVEESSRSSPAPLSCNVTAAASSSVEMTFTRETFSPAARISQDKGPSNTDFKVCMDGKFEGINLEDDIEKVEVTSSQSSDNSEEDCPSDMDFPRHLTKDFLTQKEHDFFLQKSPIKGLPEDSTKESIRSWIQRIQDMQIEVQKKIEPTSLSGANSSACGATASRVVNYQDLPYMGEMTLDNSKPRRGRKPKKADICHLIYKNYGTIFPGTPNANDYLDGGASVKKLETAKDVEKTEVQNRIISSLLEKRLTQEIRSTEKAKTDQSEPLNLCIRDLNHLKIRLFNDAFPVSAVKSEPESEEDDLPDSQKDPTTDSSNLSTPDPAKTPTDPSAPGGYVYWPNAGVFIHPMALQQHLMMYQRLNNSSNYTLPSHSPRPPPVAEKKSPELRRIVPKKVKRSEDSNETESLHSPEMKSKRNAPSSSGGGDKTPTKRKRSAIFIPPIPAENNSNPATEVSICKFKFTGGAKPSLQEKKMLSVDSGGNFRYYSGTGDKSMRGYEFFPRETLQQQINSAQGSSTGAFLQASGEKIYPVPPAEYTGAKTGPEFLLSPELPATSISPVSDCNSRHKKRKSRKSMQREKLEQTFKEKGFLIQTQQLESAEGATYCKFRQLRKFTRYLFRSWKDYLPGNVAEMQEGERMANDKEMNLPEAEIDNESVNSSELSSSNIQ